jgi:hypothetical protein
MTANRTSFKKGQSGNPSGVPKKTLADQSIHDVRAALRESEPKVRAKLLELAEAGDMAAIRLLYDKIQPSIKPFQVPYAMPISTDNPKVMATDTLASVINGIVGTEDAAKLFQMLGIQQQITETSELRKEISELKEMIFNVGNR